MKKLATLLIAILVLLGFTVVPAMALKPPVVTLERIDVASIQPFFVTPRIGYKNEKEPGKVGKYGYSSTLNLAFVFNIKNPNKEPVMLDELQFTALFEGFEVNTAISYDDQWIPAGKTNQLRVEVMYDFSGTQLSLLVVAGQELKAKGNGIFIHQIL